MSEEITEQTSATDLSSMTLVLVSCDPAHPLAPLACRFVRSHLQQYPHGKLRVFFYGDAAAVANVLRWQSADQPNLTAQWQQLATQANQVWPVCVSTALARGVSDAANSTRHQLEGCNLADGFALVGLGELATLFDRAHKVVQF